MPGLAYVTTVTSIRKHPDADRLTLVTVFGVGDVQVVANLDDNDQFRWSVGEVCVYVGDGAIVPDSVLKENGYWDEAKGKGILAGKGNRVKPRTFVGIESIGLLFKVEDCTDSETGYILRDGSRWLQVVVGQDVTDFLGLTPYTPPA